MIKINRIDCYGQVNEIICNIFFLKDEQMQGIFKIELRESFNEK